MNETKTSTQCRANRIQPINTVLAVLLLLLLVGFLPTMAIGQNYLEISVGGSFPCGDNFGWTGEKDISDIALFDNGSKGGWGLGYNVGLGFYIPCGLENMYASLLIDYHSNGLGWGPNEGLDSICRYLERTVGGSFTTKMKPYYYNIPIMTGLRYSMPLFEKAVFFIEAEVGLNVRLIKSLKIASDEMTLIRKYDTRSTMAFRFGCGLQFNNHVTVSCYIYDLGRVDINGTTITEFKSGTSPTTSPFPFRRGKSVNTAILAMKVAYSF